MMKATRWLLPVLVFGLSGCAGASPQAKAPSPSMPEACERLLASVDPIGTLAKTEVRLSRASHVMRRLSRQRDYLAQQRDFALGVADSSRADAQAAVDIGRPLLSQDASTVAELNDAKAGNAARQIQAINQQLAAPRAASLAETTWQGNVMRIAFDTGNFRAPIRGVTYFTPAELKMAFSNPRSPRQNELFCSYALGEVSDHDFSHRDTEAIGE